MIYKINNIVVTEEEFNKSLSKSSGDSVLSKYVIEDEPLYITKTGEEKSEFILDEIPFNLILKKKDYYVDYCKIEEVYNYKKSKYEKLLEEAEKHQEKIGGRVDYDRIIYGFKPTYSHNVADGSKNKEIKQKCGDNILMGLNPESFIEALEKKKETQQRVNIQQGLGIDAVKGLPLDDSKAAEKQKNSGKGIACEQSKTNTREGFIPLTGDPCKDADPLTYKVKQDRIIEEGIGSYKGIKESAAKTDYSEIDWDFIEGMAKRMSGNKNKYPKDNWKKPIDINELKQSLFRHVREIMLGNYDDEGYLGHLYATALNAQIIAYQLKNNQK